MQSGSLNLWYQNLKGDERKQLTRFDDDSVVHTTYELEFVGEACPMRDDDMCGGQCVANDARAAAVEAREAAPVSGG